MQRFYFLKTVKLIWIALLLGLLNYDCGKQKEAALKLCAEKLSPRDVVFIMDQSGTMHQNDQDAVRWESVRDAILAILSDEQQYEFDDNYTRFAIIPFGKEETIKFNPQLKWFDHSNFDELKQLLNGWYDKASKDTAQFSDFKTPFVLLEDSLPWRDNAIRFIFFISDGKYNVLFDVDSPKNRLLENRLFDRFLSYLQNKQGQLPIYFLGVGKPGFDKSGKSKVNKYCLKKMATAIPLPKYLIDNEPPPKFQNPTHIAPNLLTIVGTDTDSVYNVIRGEIEQILRGVRYYSSPVVDGDSVTFPVIRFDIVDIEICTKNKITTEELSQNLRLFVDTKNKEFSFNPLVPLYLRNEFLPGRLHRFKIDTVIVARIIPDWFNFESIESWGLKAEKVGLSKVNLIIKDNWNIKIDSCAINLRKSSKGWIRRIFRLQPPPKYDLFLRVLAKHPCGGELLRGRLKVLIENKQVKSKKYLKFDKQPSTIYSDEFEHTYLWEIEIKNQTEFKKNILKLVKIGIEIEDLRACHFDVPTEVPPNAKAIPDTTI